MSDVIKKDLLEQLRYDIQNNLSVANGYSTEPKEVKIGSFIAEDFSLFPAIGIYLYDSITTDSLLNDTYVLDLIIWLDLIIKHSSMNKLDVYQNILNYERDLNKFIRNESHWTYKPSTSWTKSGPFYFGGKNDKISQTRVEISVSILE